MADRAGLCMRQRGTIAIETALGVPVLLFVLMGGIQFGRAFITRHRLEAAVSYATRVAAVSGDASQGTVQALILSQLGSEAGRCPVTVDQVEILDLGDGSPNALRVRAVCKPEPMFAYLGLDALQVDQLSAVVTMPLSF